VNAHDVNGRPAPGAYRGVGCDVTPHVQDNEVVQVTSAHDNPVTHGNLCIKGRFGHQHVQNRG
jgi:predicted molibdopterin-dependent oxidoreductase YjgC